MLTAYFVVNQGHCQTLVEQAQELTLPSPASYNCLCQVRPVDHRDVLLRERPPHEHRAHLSRAVVLSVEGSLASPHYGWVRDYFEGNFHGRTLGVISTAPDSRGGFGPYLDGVGPTFHDNGEIRTIRYGVIEDLERALDLNGKHVAAFLVEPIQGEAGIVVPPSGYLARVRELCTKHNVLLICDGIQTVRLHFALIQSLTCCFYSAGPARCCAASMTRSDPTSCFWERRSGGVYPVSAVLVDREPPFPAPPLHPPLTSSACSNPLGCAVAMTAFCVLVDEKLSERAETLGEIAALKSPLVQRVRGKGLLNAVVIDEASGARERTAWQFCLLLKSRGVLTKPTHVNIVRFAPPLVIFEEDLRRAVNVIVECLNDLDRVRRTGEVESEKGHKDVLTN
ncbi:hypothetical protein SCLCIDRAFT_28569 [Scleroderma citrinum Foug A]|uniref:Ornithine aminotransferase n=1 Tax=Scleroderma citrinum Foug A TaxID=1036808 RepID=A0A0C2ZZH7_9AGAM|nr:hypothetical protein SCLCIDRAFT_28569 [Scleroderma citrinum Foug A]